MDPSSMARTRCRAHSNTLERSGVGVRTIERSCSASARCAGPICSARLFARRDCGVSGDCSGDAALSVWYAWSAPSRCCSQNPGEEALACYTAGKSNQVKMCLSAPCSAPSMSHAISTYGQTTCSSPTCPRRRSYSQAPKTPKMLSTLRKQIWTHGHPIDKSSQTRR